MRQNFIEIGEWCDNTIDDLVARYSNLCAYDTGGYVLHMLVCNICSMLAETSFEYTADENRISRDDQVLDYFGYPEEGKENTEDDFLEVLVADAKLEDFITDTRDEIIDMVCRLGYAPWERQAYEETVKFMCEEFIPETFNVEIKDWKELLKEDK